MNMDSKRILGFLSDVAANNNRPWFQAHKDEYLACKADFDQGIDQLIAALAKTDPQIGHLTAKDCCYRFYRDIRFSADKSPYKRHFGAYICAHGRKSIYGGYYVHLQPGQCLIACGVYFLPTNILTSCRNELMANIDEWRRIVESKRFTSLFGRPADSLWDDQTGTLTDKGFGMQHLKKMPKDFPSDYEWPDYLKMKDYTAWHRVADSFFEGDSWIQECCKVFRVAKPMMDMMNSVVADYID